MVVDQRVNKGVIIAAGDGDRLGWLTASCPKVLLPVNNKALIGYPIEAMAAAGISQIAIVVGYLGDKVAEVLGDGRDFGVKIHYIFNHDYIGGSAISVYKARDWAQEAPFVLCMGDHVIERRLVKHLLDRPVANDTLCIDYTPAQHHQLDEATKVIVDKAGCIKDIGKSLAYWDALDTGVFFFTERFLNAIDELFPEFGTELEITDVVRFMVSQGNQFATRDVSGYLWADIDTEEDYSKLN